MENKKAAILVLAIIAALIVTASGAYAMGRGGNSAAGLSSGITGRSGIGPSMMGGSTGNSGGMMGGNGMMRSGGGMGSTCGYMGECMDRYWNSTAH